MPSLITSRLQSLSIFVSLVAAALAFTASAQTTAEDPVLQLEAFIATESALATDGGILPTSRPTSSVFGDQSLLDTPRSVTVLTPELMARFDIQDFDDLARIGAGTQQTNYYGVPGSPVLRGAIGGVYFNGIQRAYQRNEMPLSFGSFDGLDVVKGPAPSHFGAGQVGGYTNLIPKTPYFDRQRSSVTLEVGTAEHYRAQYDTGAPFLLGDSPAAYRLSLTGQYGGTPYDRVRNDFVSLYGSLKIRLSSHLTLFTGAEAFRFKSNENAGWNRPSQNLIDRNQYVIGEPINIASSAWAGRANRDAIYHNTALVVPASIVDAGVLSGLLSSAQRDLMLNLASPADRASAYASFAPADLASISQSASGYQYTPTYLAAGGHVFTAPIAARTVLASDEDFADADNLLYFANLVQQRDNGATLTGQFLLDYIHTNKISTYGYGVSTDQLIMEAKLSHRRQFDWLDTTVTSGASIRRSHSILLQDFFDEPFSRRDITRPAISPNSVIPVGPQTDPNGVNFWSPTAQGGANADSTLWQSSLFAYAQSHPTDRLTTFLSLLATHAPYRTVYPNGVDRVSANSPLRDPISDQKNYGSVSFSPVYALTPQTRLYSTVQYGTSLDPIDGGAIIGKGNFASNELIEVGLKTSLLDDTLFAALSTYRWAQSAFSVRDNAAQELEGRGTEFEFTYAPSEAFSLIGSVGYQRINRITPLGFRSIPLTESQWALYGGQLSSPFSGISAANGFAPYSSPASNPSLEYPGTPQTQVKLRADFALPGNLRFGLSTIWSDAYWQNFDRTLRLPRTLSFDATLGYHAENWSATLHGSNLTDADLFYGSEPVFAANTLLTRAPGPAAKLVFKFNY